MKKRLPVIARVVLGLVFFASGVFGFVTKFQTPPDLPENLLTFTKGLAASIYFMPFLKGTEIFCGALLIAGAYVPLALVILAPIVINIVLTHLFLAPSGMLVALIILALEIYLAFFVSPYKAVILNLFKPHRKISDPS